MAPLVRTGGSRHTGLAALPHRNIQIPDPSRKASIFDMTSHKQDVVQIAIELDKSPRELISMERKHKILLRYS